MNVNLLQAPFQVTLRYLKFQLHLSQVKTEKLLKLIKKSQLDVSTD